MSTRVAALFVGVALIIGGALSSSDYRANQIALPIFGAILVLISFMENKFNPYAFINPPIVPQNAPLIPQNIPLITDPTLIRDYGIRMRAPSITDNPGNLLGGFLKYLK
jgi:hypothetical protein